MIHLSPPFGSLPPSSLAWDSLQNVPAYLTSSASISSSARALSPSLPPSLTADRYLGLNWLKGERKPVELRRQAVGGDPAYLPDLFMLPE